jgi:transposase
LYGREVWRVIRNLKDKGMSNREIARRMGISRNTVSKMLKRTRIQGKKKRKRGSKLDPYMEHIRTLKDKHNLSGVMIVEEIRKLCYHGGTQY